MKIIRKIFSLFLFIGYYLWKIITSNLIVAYDILTPGMRTNPGVIEVEVSISSDFGILLFSNLISMTPGTLSMDLDRKRNTLLVHLLYLDRREATEREISQMMNKIRNLTE